MKNPKVPRAYDEDLDRWIDLPHVMEVCPTCRGKGSRVNPAVDGWSYNDEHVDEEFVSNYFSGLYDVQCDTCSGLRVIAVPDESLCPSHLLQQWNKDRDDEALAAEMARMESRYF